MTWKLGFLLGILFYVIGFSSSANGADIRNANWGMTKDEVKESEKKATFLGDSESSLTYSVKLADRQCLLVYKFRPEGIPSNRWILCEVMYHSSSSGSIDADEQILVFNEWCKNLTAKYGKPNEVKETWDLPPGVESKKNDPQYRKLALSVGFLHIEKTWIDGKVNISCKIFGNLDGDMGRVRVKIQYKNIDLAEEEAEMDLGDF